MSRLDPAGSRWAAAALRGEVEALRRAEVGNRNNSLNRAALKLGRLVVSHGLDRAAAEQALLVTARQIGLGDHEALATIKSGLDAGVSKQQEASAPKSNGAGMLSAPKQLGSPKHAGEAAVGDGAVGDGAPFDELGVSRQESDELPPWLDENGAFMDEPVIGLPADPPTGPEGIAPASTPVTVDPLV